MTAAADLALLKLELELLAAHKRKLEIVRQPLGEFIPRISPTLANPLWLQPLLSAFERIKAGEPMRVLLSVPPQHGKTVTEIHGIAQLLSMRPERTNAFVAYSANIAQSKSRICRDYALRAGVQLRSDSNAVHEWRTMQGGGLLATGVGGPLTSHAVDGLMLVDDPHKNRIEAESQIMRNNVHEWFSSTAMTRIHPSTAVMVVHTRWHVDDLIGRLSTDRKADGSPVWEVINIPALSDDQVPLWRKREFYDEARARSEYDWWSMWMGEPRAKGGSVFEDVHYYDQLPKTYRLGIGLDLAYTAKTHADWSVAVVLAESDGKYYVLDVKREQTEAVAFARTLAGLRASYPGAQMRWYTGGQERTIADFMGKQLGFRIMSEPAKGDKFVRAQPVAAAWREGKIFLPRSAPWLEPFIQELLNFTGVADRTDDQVDAFSAAFDMCQRGGAFSVKKLINHFRIGGGLPWKSDKEEAKVKW